MRISLFHNEDAGSAVALSQVREAIERHGHDIVQVVNCESALERLLDEKAELVVLAGGDGTVAAAAPTMAGQGIALTILPLGTANNVAKALHLDGDLDQLIQGWDRCRRRPFDLGICQGLKDEIVFLESAGHGLIATGISTMKAQAPDANERPAARLARAVRNYREALSTLNARPFAVTLDGRQLDGDFLMIEVLNTRSIGPNLVLSPDADPSDGFFSVVMARDDHRDELAAYLERQPEEGDVSPSLLTERARRVDIEGPAMVHVDGEIYALSGPVSFRIDAAALEFLA